MNETQLIEWLKANLTIKLEEKAHDDFYRGVTGYDIIASIIINEEIITQSSISIEIK